MTYNHMRMDQNEELTKDNNPVQPTPPAATSSPPPERSLKILWFGLLEMVIIGVSILFGVYIGKNQITNQATTPTQSEISISPTTSPTPTAENTNPESYSDWKMYQDSTVGISIQYPPTWFLVGNRNGTVQILSSDPDDGGNLSGLTINSKSYDTPFTDSTFMDKLEEEFLTYGSGDIKANKENLVTTTIGGVSAYKGTSDAAPENLWSNYYFFYKEDTIFKIETIENLDAPEKKEKEIFTQILSSLTFSE